MRALQSADINSLIQLIAETDFNIVLNAGVLATGVSSANSAERAQRLEALRVALQAIAAE